MARRARAQSLRLHERACALPASADSKVGGPAARARHVYGDCACKVPHANVRCLTRRTASVLSLPARR